jgi:hypothetical protein
MALLRGLKAIHQSAVANRPHILGHQTARSASNDTLCEIWNGPTNADRKFVVDKDGKPYSAALTAGDLLYAVAGGVTSVRRLDPLVIGTPYQTLRVNSAGNAPEWGSGRLTTDTTPVSTSGTGEDNLISYAVPAAVLGVNGQLLRVTAWGTITGVAGGKTLKFYFGASSITLSGAAVAMAVAWYVTILVIRTGATAQSLAAGGITDNGMLPVGSAAAPLAAVGTAAETLSGAVTLKLTGECANGADTITQSGLLVEFLG